MNQSGQPGAFSSEQEENFNLTELFRGYVSKPEVTALSPSFLVPGSKNVLVDYANRIISRNGYTLYNQASTGAGGIKSSYDWETSTGAYFSLRAFDHALQFDWNSTYNTLLSNLRSTDISFAKVLDYSEQSDVLLFVNGDGAVVRRWSGGASLVRSSTAATLTKAGVLTAVTTVAFVAGDGVTVNPTITDTAANFLNAKFAAGDELHISGSTGNSSNFTIASVTAGTITLIMSDVLVNEAVGGTITMYNQTGPTWKSARFFSTISGRAVTYNGVSYIYSGGETTDTLTGLTAFPVVTAGDAVWQTPDSFNLPSDVTSPFPLFYPDLIAVQLNMVFIAATNSQMVFASSNSSYINFALTTPRVPGGPVQQPLTSGRCTCIIPMDSDADVLNVTNTLIFGSGIDAFDQIDFRMSQDNSAELLRIIRYKTAAGSGLISKNAICPIKNDTIYITREPSLATMSRAGLEGSDKHVPISDPIKNDFDSYDFTGANVRYHKRSIYIALPAEGIQRVYDMMRNLWQPPQTIPVSCYSIINDELYGHSAVTNETYKLNTGTDDNGVFIPQVARFAYNNGGTPHRLKNFTEYYTAGYITASGELDYTLAYGFGGGLGVRTYTIMGTDSTIVTSQDASPIGDEGLGEVPFGGAPFGDIIGLPGSEIPLQWFYQIDTTDSIDYPQFYVEYACNTLGAQFAIVRHGSNAHDADTADITHKK